MLFRSVPSDVESCNPNLIYRYDTNWWILKSPVLAGKKVRAEHFSGKYLKSSELAVAQVNLRSQRNNNRGQLVLGDLTEGEVLKEMAIRPVYYKNEKEPIPVPLASIYTVLEWPSVPELRNLTPPNQYSNRTYRWTWSGSCNLYEKDGDGTLVLVSRNENDQNCRASQQVQKTPVYSHFSKSFSSGCFEVVVDQPLVIVNRVGSSIYSCW